MNRPARFPTLEAACYFLLQLDIRKRNEDSSWIAAARLRLMAGQPISTLQARGATMTEMAKLTGWSFADIWDFCRPEGEACKLPFHFASFEAATAFLDRGLGWKPAGPSERPTTIKMLNRGSDRMTPDDLQMRFGF